MAKKCDLGLLNWLTGELVGLQYSSLPVFMQVRVFAAIILLDVANKMCSLKSEQLGIPRGCVQHFPQHTMWLMFGYQNSGTVFHSIGILEHPRVKQCDTSQAIGQVSQCVM
jgi:hypothetical protein